MNYVGVFNMHLTAILFLVHQRRNSKYKNLIIGGVIQSVFRDIHLAAILKTRAYTSMSKYGNMN